MTELKDRPQEYIEKRREQLLSDNKTHLNRGEWGKYAKNCKRIAAITRELNRRKSEQFRREWEVYVT